MTMRRRSVQWVAACATPPRACRRRFHGQTVQHALAEARARLRAVGVDGSDAKALVAHALRLATSNELFLWTDRKLREDESETLKATLQRRLHGEPLAYVLGVKEFWSLELEVTKDTLIPRADSEALIEYLAGLYPKSSPLRILDLGTGSGALLLASLVEYQTATGIGVDISKGALDVARRNAERLGLGNRSAFVEYDMEKLSAIGKDDQDERVAEKILRKFDVILCNPPYIPLSEVELIAPDVLAHEPHGALFSEGPDAWIKKLSRGGDGSAINTDDLGLRFYIALRDSVSQLLDPQSPFPRSVIVEIGSERQANAVRDLFNDVPTLSFDCFLKDTANRHRGVTFRTSES